jgi:glycosyltransferase involved in cell wall biosynthesis
VTTPIASSPRVCALLPAYNEAARIGITVDALRSCRSVDRVVVVDDGSTDDTAARARAAGADQVVTQRNGGKGAAMAAAYRTARADADIFLLLDADLGASAAECEKLLPPLWDDADMVVGTLPPDPEFAAAGRRGGLGLVVRLARWGIARRTGRSFRQPLSGQRAVRREVLEAVGGRFAAGFGVEVGLTLGALGAGFRVVEVETEFRHHVTGTDWPGLRHRARQLVDVARVVWKG